MEECEIDKLESTWTQMTIRWSGVLCCGTTWLHRACLIGWLSVRMRQRGRRVASKITKSQVTSKPLFVNFSHLYHPPHSHYHIRCSESTMELANSRRPAHPFPVAMHIIIHWNDCFSRVRIANEPPIVLPRPSLTCLSRLMSYNNNNTFHYNRTPKNET